MATVYSYIRFSSKPQEQGDSVRRQTGMGEAWLNRHPEHTIDSTLRLRDLGVSAFKGRNLDRERGDLGKFLALAQDGKIERGSILMLENLDRFSRQPPRKAYRAFCDLVEAGVRVLTLDPEQLIDEKNIDSMEVVLTIIIKMQLAHEESRKKAARQVENWAEKRRRARATKEPMTRHCPGWLSWDDSAGKWTVKAGAKATMAYIFQRTCDGLGKQRLLAELNGKFKPFGKAKRWNGSMVSSILHDRTVLGELLPHRKVGDSQPPIVDYYPRLVPDDLYYRARAAIESRRMQPGRNSQWVNLFVGLVKFPDGHGGTIQTATWSNGGGRHTARRFVSVGHRERVKGACPLSVEYGKVERYILAALYQLTPDDLLGKTGATDKTIAAKERELAGMESRLAELDKALTTSKTPVPQLVAAISELTAQRDIVRREIDQLKGASATARANPVKAVQDLLAVIESAPESKQHGLRLKLRGLVSAIVERVEIDPYKVASKTGGWTVEARLVVRWRGCGVLKSVAFDTGVVSADKLAAAVNESIPPLEAIGKKRLLAAMKSA
jgi:DNA invertase Pin-like site-specific DNA recombinase